MTALFWSHSLLKEAGETAYGGAQIAVALHCLYATPIPGSLQLPSNRFSEARALQHVQYLAGLPERQVKSNCKRVYDYYSCEFSQSRLT